MNERWDLTSIYTGLEAPEFAADLEKLDETVKSLEAFAKKLPRQDFVPAGPHARSKNQTTAAPTFFYEFFS
mgnify:FL=1